MGCAVKEGMYVFSFFNKKELKNEYLREVYHDYCMLEG